MSKPSERGILQNALGAFIIACIVIVLASPTSVQAGAASPGCLGACSNSKNSADGWCDDCAAHCQGGTEAECVNTCWDKCNRASGTAKSDACPDGNGWKACLGACGGVKGCRNSWCDGNHPERDRCHADVQTAYGECQRRCGGDVPKGCEKGACMGFLMLAKCGAERRVVGACLGMRIHFP